MLQYIKKILSSHLCIMVAALVVGIAFPQIFVLFAPYSTVVLGGIFFLSALTMRFGDVRRYAGDPVLLVLVLFLMLVAFPVVVYYLTLAWHPSLALAFLLLAAMPSGMTAPLLTEIAGGKRSLALVLTVLTSLVAPFSVPLVLEVLLGSGVGLDVWGMFETLVLVVGVPFALAYGVRTLAPARARNMGEHSKWLSILLLGVLVSSIVAEQAALLLSELSFSYAAGTVFALVVVFALLHALGYFAVFWRAKEERVAVSVCLTYMNFVLALYLADTFFPEQEAVLPIILAIIPWALMVTPFRIVLQKFS